MGTARKTLLVTGFGAFPGVARNPSAELIARLAAAPPDLVDGIAASFHLLPVTWAMLEDELPALYEAHRPHAVVHFGVASKRRTVCIETRAKNAASQKSADAEGAIAPLSHLVAGGPEALRTPLAVSRLVAAARTSGVTARASRDAGDYLCNATYWTSLAAGHRAVFVHVPHAAETGTAAGLPGIDDLERMARAVISAVAGGL